jgi:muramoyltetrapeptide carboxypeptidase LdcA involved in peptidoglycan recycling
MEVGSLPDRQDIVLPRAVGPGAHIRIVSPSWPSIFYTPQRVARAEAAMEDLGFTFSYGKHASGVSEDGNSAGTSQERAQDIMEAFTDDAVDAVLSAAGGGTTQELLPLLDGDVIASSGKPFIGYCNNVWLNQYLLDAGIYSYYGIAYVAHFGEPGGIYPEVAAGVRAAICGEKDIVCRPVDGRTSQYFNWQDPEMERRVRVRNVPGGWNWIHEGSARGPFIGCGAEGMPALIEHFGLDLDGAILFWDVGPTTLRPLSYLLKEIAARADLTKLGGMVVGANVRSKPERWAAAVSAALESVVGDIGYPVVVNADIGHVDPVWVTPYGMDAILDSLTGLRFPRAELSGRPAASS